MKPIYFVLFWLFSTLSWGVFIFVLYNVVPFMSIFEYVYKYYPGIIGDDIWDNYVTDLSIYTGGFLNCIFIYFVAKLFFRRKQQ